MKVLIQPVFIADDGENLTEVALANEQGVQGPIPVSAAEWPGYADTLERQRQEHEERMNAEAPVAANRQQRRAAQRAKVNGKGE